jgi:hypothetical protein
MYDRIDPQKQERERLEQLQREQRRVSSDVQQQTRYPSREAREIEDLKHRLLELNQAVQYLTQELLEWNTDPETKRDQLFDQSVKQAAQKEVKRIMAPQRAELAERVEQLEDATRKIQALQSQINAQMVEAQRFKEVISAANSQIEQTTSDKNHVLRVNEGLREQIKSLKVDLAPYLAKEASEQAARVAQERLEQTARAEQQRLEQEEAAKQLETIQELQAEQAKQTAIDAAIPNRALIGRILGNDNKDREGKTKSLSQRTNEVADLLKRYSQDKRVEFLESFMLENPEEAYLIFQKADLATHKRFVELGPMFSKARGLDKLEEPKKAVPQKPVDSEHAKSMQDNQKLETQQKTTLDTAEVERLAWSLVEDFQDRNPAAQQNVKDLPPKLRVPVFQFIKDKVPKVWGMYLESWYGQELKDAEQQTEQQNIQESSLETMDSASLETFSSFSADMASPEVQSKRTPAQHIAAFKQALKLEVLKRLDRNSKRLDTELESYRDTSTKNPEWQRLHQLADKDAELLETRIKFASQLPNLLVQQGFSTRAMMPQFAHPDGGMHLHEDGFINALYGEWSRNHPPGAGRNTQAANQERLEQFEEQIQPIRALFGNAGKVENARDFLHAQFPALAALGKGGAVRDVAKQDNSSQSNQALLATMKKRFGDVQGVIGTLEDKFNDGYLPVLELDVVTKAVLKDQGVTEAERKSGDTQSKAVLDWLDGERRNQTAISLGLLLGQVGFTAASFFFPGGFLLPAAAIGTGVVGAGLDYAQASSTAELAQAGQYGEKLTSTELDQARFQQVLSAANLALSIAAPALAGIKGQSAAVRGVSEAEAMRRAQWDIELAANPRLQQGGVANYLSVNQTALAHGYPTPPKGMFYVPEGNGFQLRSFPEEIKSGGQMVKNPNFVDDAPRMQTRFDEDTGGFLELVEGNARVVKVPLEANVTAKQIFEAFTNAKSKSSFKPFAEMLEREGIATDKDILKAIEELRPKFKTYDDLRHALKERFKPELFKKMLDPKLTPEEQHGVMMRLTTGLDSSDLGNIRETWYRRAFHPNGLDKTKVDQDALKAAGIELKANRFPDVIENNTIYEVKSGKGALQGEALEQFEDNMALIGERGHTIPFKDGSSVLVNKCVYVFTDPDGVKANLKWMERQILSGDFPKLSFEVFTPQGQRFLVNKDNFRRVLAEFAK